MYLYMCVVFIVDDLVNRGFVVLFGNDEVIEVHFGEWWGKN